MDKKKTIKKPKLGDIFCDHFGDIVLVIEKEQYRAKVVGMDKPFDNFRYYVPYWSFDYYKKIGNIFEGKNNEN